MLQTVVHSSPPGRTRAESEGSGKMIFCVPTSFAFADLRAKARQPYDEATWTERMSLTTLGGRKNARLNDLHFRSRCFATRSSSHPTALHAVCYQTLPARNATVRRQLSNSVPSAMTLPFYVNIITFEADENGSPSKPLS